MNKTHENIGNLVRQYRQKSTLTQMELAVKLGYNTPQFVSLFERGLSKIPLETLGQLVVLLKIPEKRIMKLLVTGYESEIHEKISTGKKSARN
jgi:transcriptional regulator with XRE-family HTH domain